MQNIIGDGRLFLRPLRLLPPPPKKKKKFKVVNVASTFYDVVKCSVFVVINCTNMGLTPSSPGPILIKLGSARLVIILNLMS